MRSLSGTARRDAIEIANRLLRYEHMGRDEAIRSAIQEARRRHRLYRVRSRTEFVRPRRGRRTR